MTTALKTLTVISVIILVVSGTLLIVDNNIDDVYVYDEEYGGYVLTECHNISIFVTIPSEYNGKPVVGIAEHAFSIASPGVLNVTLPDTIKVIKERAFEGTHLTKINLPKNLEIIGKYAFLETNLDEIVIPSSCKLIDSYAFDGVKLENVYIEGGYIPLEIRNCAFREAKFPEIYLPLRVACVRKNSFTDHRGSLVINCEARKGYFETEYDWDNINLISEEHATVNYNVPREDKVNGTN